MLCRRTLTMEDELRLCVLRLLTKFLELWGGGGGALRPSTALLQLPATPNATVMLTQDVCTGTHAVALGRIIL